MDELTLVAQLRDGYPAGIDLTEPERRLAGEIRAAADTGPDHRTRRMGGTRSASRFGPKLVVTGAVAAAVAVGAVVALQTVPSHPAVKAGGSSRTTTDAIGLQLASYASRAAASVPAWQPNQWVYSDILRPQALPKPAATNPTITWTQVDGHQFAYYRDGKLVIRNEVPYLGQLTSVFEKTVTEGGVYSYLLSLPTTPAALRAVIVHNLETSPIQKGPLPPGTGNYGVWQTIETTLIGTVLPPKLLAAVYGILATDPAVHFDKSVTDNAGQTGVGFYIVRGDVWKEEIMINPSTYAFMGIETIALTTQTQHHTIDGHNYTRTIKKGLNGFTDLVNSGIVQEPGQTP
jgi:hypothetical protein